VSAHHDAVDGVPGPPEVRHVMGMPIEIDVRDAAAVDVEPAFAWLRRADATFSTYRSDSDISRLDRGELGLAECRPEVDEVLTACVALARETHGFFSVRAAGRLDPSGYVKGWAVAGAAERLAAAGARAFCINAGGDVVARGRPAPGRRWRVGIRHPEDRRRLAAVLAVEDLAVATSGAYERGAHIVDPHTGRPPAGLLSATVVGPDLARADAYATAAFAMGRDGPAWTATLDGYDAMCVASDRRVLTTPGFARHRC
jgi:thiamine biosynthesis lipoprotein